MVCTPYRASSSELPMAAAHDSSDIGRERRFAGKQIVTCGFKLTTEFFIPANSSSRRNQVAI